MQDEITGQFIDEFDFSHADTCTCFICRNRKPAPPVDEEALKEAALSIALISGMSFAEAMDSLMAVLRKFPGR